jgi:hypothetical protein
VWVSPGGMPAALPEKILEFSQNYLLKRPALEKFDEIILFYVRFSKC